MNEPLVDVAGIFNRALAIYREHANVLFPAALIVGLLQAIFFFAFEDAPGVAVAVLVPALIAFVFFQTITVEVARDVQDGRAERSTDELLRHAAPIVPRVLLVTLLSGIGVAIGYLLLIVPGLILLTIWAVVVPITVIERPGGLDAFRRSVELVRGRGWQVFGLLVLVFVVLFVVAIVSAILAVLVGGVGSTAGQFVQLLGTSAVLPVAPLVTAVLYFRLVEIDAERKLAYPPPSGPPVVPEVPPVPAEPEGPTGR